MSHSSSAICTFLLSISANTTHLSSKGTLLVDVVSHTGLSWGLEAESRVAHEPEAKCYNVLAPMWKMLKK